MIEYPLQPASKLQRTTWESPIGPLGLVARDGKLASVQFQADPVRFPQEVERTFGSPGRESKSAFKDVVLQLEEYFAGRRLVFRLPLDLQQGTPFQRLVWKALGDIPYGRTMTYKEVAEAIGRPSALRAVGSANGANPIPVVIPCHRVVASGGKIGGFGGGIAVKRKLLSLELQTSAQAARYGIFGATARQGTLRPQPPLSR